MNPRGFISGRTLQAWAFHCGVFLLAVIVITALILAGVIRPGG